jgi:hypothetical protein
MPAVARLIADYDALVDAIRERVDEMGMTRLELDHQAGMQEGYSGKNSGAEACQNLRHEVVGGYSRRDRLQAGARRGFRTDRQDARPHHAAATSGPTSRGRWRRYRRFIITASITPPIIAKATAHMGHAGATPDRSIRLVNPKFRAIEYPLASFRFVNLSAAKW